jgi:hypothetical protein
LEVDWPSKSSSQPALCSALLRVLAWGVLAWGVLAWGVLAWGSASCSDMPEHAAKAQRLATARRDPSSGDRPVMHASFPSVLEERGKLGEERRGIKR